MPQTASWHGLSNPFDPIEALQHSPAYLRELMNQFGNLGLAAAAYNAGPTRVSAWLTSHRLTKLVTICSPASELASASNPFDLCLDHSLNQTVQVFVQP